MSGNMHSRAQTGSVDWQGWYRRAIPHAEELYAEYLKEREAEDGR
jgi:hypothetical protein